MNNLNDEQLNRLYDRIEQLEKENEKLKEEKHAHWEVLVRGLEEDNHGTIRHWTMFRCTRCGNIRKAMDMYIPSYCEGCGAKMEIGNDE